MIFDYEKLTKSSQSNSKIHKTRKSEVHTVIPEFSKTIIIPK